MESFRDTIDAVNQARTWKVGPVGGEKRGMSGRAGPELSGGTPRVQAEAVFLCVPPPSPGWTWPLRFRTLAFVSTGEPGEGRLYSGDSWLPAFRGAGPRRPEVPAWFPCPVRPKPSGSEAWALSGRLDRSEDRPWRPDQRAGPVRFEPRVSPVFRAAVSLGPLTFRRNRLLGKRSNLRPWAPDRDSWWISL